MKCLMGGNDLIDRVASGMTTVEDAKEVIQLYGAIKIQMTGIVALFALLTVVLVTRGCP